MTRNIYTERLEQAVIEVATEASQILGLSFHSCFTQGYSRFEYQKIETIVSKVARSNEIKIDSLKQIILRDGAKQSNTSTN